MSNTSVIIAQLKTIIKVGLCCTFFVHAVIAAVLLESKSDFGIFVASHNAALRSISNCHLKVCSRLMSYHSPVSWQPWIISSFYFSILSHIYTPKTLHAWAHSVFLKVYRWDWSVIRVLNTNTPISAVDLVTWHRPATPVSGLRGTARSEFTMCCEGF